MPRLLYIYFITQILCGYYSRVAFIKLRGIATATDAEIEKPDTFADIDEDENELEENEVEKTVSPLLSAILKLK